jgi:hypothetical protein
MFLLMRPKVEASAAFCLRGREHAVPYTLRRRLTVDRLFAADHRDRHECGQKDNQREFDECPHRCRDDIEWTHERATWLRL